MAERKTITVSITPQLRAFVAGRLATGRYNNASEVVRAALRLLERDEGDAPADQVAPTRRTPSRA